MSHVGVRFEFKLKLGGKSGELPAHCPTLPDVGLQGLQGLQNKLWQVMSRKWELERSRPARRTFSG